MAQKLSVLSRLRYAFNRCNFTSFCLKPLQVKCFGYLLKGKDVAVLPPGFGKCLLLICDHIANLQRLFNTRISIRVTRQASRELAPHNVLLRKTKEISPHALRIEFT